MRVYSILVSKNAFPDFFMSIPQSSHAPASVLGPAIARLGIPVFLFSVVFLAATLVLRLLLTPDRFPVRIGDRVVRLSDLEQEQKLLMEQRADLTNRQGFVTESRAPVLHQMRLLAARIPPIGRVLMGAEEARSSFRAGGSDPVSFSQITADGSGATVTLVGDVKNAGDRSMQILASFVDGLRAMPLPVSVSEPEYVQRTHPDGTVSSPFTIHISLTHAALR